ncbi:phospholipase A2 inhibitor gamma subunit B-like [Poeciliopsis prolifica]|uniref:phospholipase A2 inhibitor gamma subunit B-like n=1 Tax=Poeciliopsis prolifica TaxID=188132 RepID=UPI0024136740|nr:phospholipase A2 inhibitor gamma subunit B-like [Poeciliopsis prolifica]
MFLFTLVLGVLFLPEADNLKCKCESNTYGSCSQETTECSSQFDRCLAGIQVTTKGGMDSELKYKNCFKSEMCLNSSINYGAYRFAQKTRCCSGDLCNAQIDYPTPDYKSNGRKCFSCEGENCMKTLNCAGDENYCIKATDGVITLKGCASEMICSDTSASRTNQFASRTNQFASRVNQFASWVNQSASRMNQFTGPKISCCKGNYCNSASSTSPILMLLLVPLFFSALFS